MNNPLPGMGLNPSAKQDQDSIVQVHRQSDLRRILAFARWSIDDVVNNPIARRDVQNWYKMSRWLQRQVEIGELERQWNPLR